MDTNYFIDWSEWAVNRMKTLTIKQRNIEKGKSGGPDKICSRFQNIEYYFLDGIDYSQTGVYSPTFRRNSKSVFNTEATSIFTKVNLDEVLGVLCSKMTKFFIKNFIDSTVHASVDKLKETAFPLSRNSDLLQEKVTTIFNKQDEKKYYDFASNEQIEIDKLIFDTFKLQKSDIQEVENWYARRYPRLVKAQKENLEAQGKPNDYLELYEELEEGGEVTT